MVACFRCRFPLSDSASPLRPLSGFRFQVSGKPLQGENNPSFVILFFFLLEGVAVFFYSLDGYGAYGWFGGPGGIPEALTDPVGALLVEYEPKPIHMNLVRIEAHGLSSKSSIPEVSKS